MSTAGANRLLVPALFALLVAGALAATVVAQRLRSEPDLIEGITATRWISPNGDGVRELAVIGFRVAENDRADIEIVDREENLVKRLARNRRLRANRRARFVWDGRTRFGDAVPDGHYFLRVTLREQARTIVSPRKIFVDTTPPRRGRDAAGNRAPRQPKRRRR